ncbi:MAG TPA: NAD(P)/FAD-dependent oxidoreductase [Flavisolibacter sp.]|nr:NAD(P)/FAD-dependent oxidoreductase [Flavisolibacter sp.]
MQNTTVYDCIIIGGGPAGLNAAVVLGRCSRKLLLFDTESYRNRYSHGMHNYLTRDHMLPTEFLKLCHQELDKYGVQRLMKKIISARKNAEGLFEVRDEGSACYHARKLLVATGLTDNVPPIEGFAECYGRSVFHCPYCDGWEIRNKKIGVYARNKEGWELALSLKTWSRHVTLYTDGRNKVKSFQQEYLDANGIIVMRQPFARLEHESGELRKIIFSNGEESDCDALFFVNGFMQQCNLAEAFGCEMSKKGVVLANSNQQTNIEGLYVAGDAARDMHFVVVAAAEGAKAAVTINKELQRETWEANLRSNRTTALVDENLHA